MKSSSNGCSYRTRNGRNHNASHERRICTVCAKFCNRFKTGLAKLRFAGRMRPEQGHFVAREWFRDELAEKFCKQPNQFSVVSIVHHQNYGKNQMKIWRRHFFWSSPKFLSVFASNPTKNSFLVRASSNFAARSSKSLSIPAPRLYVAYAISYRTPVVVWLVSGTWSLSVLYLRPDNTERQA